MNIKLCVGVDGSSRSSMIVTTLPLLVSAMVSGASLCQIGSSNAPDPEQRTSAFLGALCRRWVVAQLGAHVADNLGKDANGVSAGWLRPRLVFRRFGSGGGS